MRLEGIQTGDIVEVDHNGRRFYALVIGPAPGGLALQPTDRRVNHYTCRSREVVRHWVKRGRPRTTTAPLQPSAALTLRVHAGIALRIAPRVTSAGHKIVFTGALRGAPIPPGGKQLVLEASSGGEWVEFRTITTDAKGHYHASYRFKFPGPVTYRFRVYAPHEADFSFLEGTSNVVGVFER